MSINNKSPFCTQCTVNYATFSNPFLCTYCFDKNAGTKKQSDFWKSQDGRETLISDLQDNHLSNIIAMLKRRVIGAFGWVAPNNQVLNDKLTACFVEWPSLLKEAKARKLLVVKEWMDPEPLLYEKKDKVSKMSIVQGVRQTSQNLTEYDLPDGWYHSKTMAPHLFFAIVGRKCRIFFNNGRDPRENNYSWPVLDENLSNIIDDYSLLRHNGNGFYAHNELCIVPNDAVLYHHITHSIDGVALKPPVEPDSSSGMPIALVASGCLLIAGLLGASKSKSKPAKTVAKQSVPAKVVVA